MIKAATIDASSIVELRDGYKVCMLCFDSKIGVQPYEDSPEKSPIFGKKEDAFMYARELAEDECDYLNGEDSEKPEKGISFGIPEDEKYQKGEKVTVNYYYNPDGDTTGNTEPVTIYFIKHIKYAEFEVED